MNEIIGSRFSRWSQRKLAARHGGAVPDEVEDAAATIHPGDEPLPPALDRQDLSLDQPSVVARSDKAADIQDGADATAVEDEDAPELPSIESLTAQSDYTVFLRKNVPEAIRRAALRKLWNSDPVFANLDGLNDYDEDFSIVTAMTMDDTSYKIGRGFLEDDEPKPQSEPELDPKLAQTDDAPADDEPAESEVEAGSEDDESQSLHDGPDREVGSSGDGNGDAPAVDASDAPQHVGAVESVDKPDPDVIV